MKTALILTAFNRPEYLKRCLSSLKYADLSRIDEVCIIDDASTDFTTKTLINQSGYNIITNANNGGIKKSLLTGYDYYFGKCYDLVINLDGDALVRKDFANKLIDNYFCGILTGFHSTTRNANGSERHKILYEEAGLYVKQSVGGINMCINNESYVKHVRPALLQAGNWDHNSCISAGYAYCLKESVIEHIGYDSSMGHVEQPDVADGFYFHKLPDVSLVCVDGRGGEYIDKPVKESVRYLRFADTVTISETYINNVETYSQYIMHDLYKAFNTSHCLIIQHDGYVLNPETWNNDWLQYDYIGATWWYKDGMNVGNGGFSLRSRRLMEICATDSQIKLTHPEDHHICRTYRAYLEETYGIKFAPEHVADDFSYEGYRQPGKKLGTQFGFHGKRNMRKPTGKKYVIGQFRGLGDILFLVPMVRALVDEGNECLWPIASEYMNIAKHFPDLNMVDMATMPINYNARMRIPTAYGEWLPYRYAMEICLTNLTKCMQSKYAMYGHDWRMWRELDYKRFPEREGKLKELVGATEEYTLVNRNFGEAERGAMVDVDMPKGKVIEMRVIEGYSLIDWLGVIEGAKEIHTANTSINYLLELLDLKMPIHLYPRGTWGEVAYEHTAELWESGKFIYH